MTDTCATCFFGQTFANISPGTQNTQIRLCRRQPPGPGVNNLSVGAQQLFWPPVQDSDWCGLGVDNTTGNSFAPVTPLPPPWTQFTPVIGSSPAFSNASAIMFYTEDSTHIVSFQGTLTITVNGFTITSCTLTMPVAPKTPPHNNISIIASFTPAGGATVPCNGTILVDTALISLVGFGSGDGTVVAYSGSYRAAA